MRVAVYRRKLPEGLGPPEAFLGNDHPTEGDWHLSAKSEQPDGVEHRRMLLQMARDFLIRSMYHATDPHFIGVAVENYGAACQKLGLKLPLTEQHATWPNYERSEVTPASPEQYRWMFSNIAKVFGADAAKEQAKTLGVQWPREITPEQLAEQMKVEILQDVRDGRVPADIMSFSQLHDFVDANCYGGTETLLDEWDDAAPDTDAGHRAALDKLCDLCNPAMDIVDKWIKGGGVREASRSWTTSTKRNGKGPAR